MKNFNIKNNVTREKKTRWWGIWKRATAPHYLHGHFKGKPMRQVRLCSALYGFQATESKKEKFPEGAHGSLRSTTYPPPSGRWGRKKKHKDNWGEKRGQHVTRLNEGSPLRRTLMGHPDWKKKWSHFDLKNWVTGGTNIQPGIPSNWRIFESNWLDIESQFVLTLNIESIWLKYSQMTRNPWSNFSSASDSTS